MSEHSIIYDLQHPTSGTWKCSAPPRAFCHAEFDCGCESIWNYRVKDGVPMHDSSPDRLGSETHTGHFNDGLCTIQLFHDEADETVEGEIAVEVEPEWQGEWYTFTATAARVEDGNE